MITRDRENSLRLQRVFHPMSVIVTTRAIMTAPENDPFYLRYVCAIPMSLLLTSARIFHRY